jgi:C-terminal processing protease CtpA/Prc
MKKLALMMGALGGLGTFVGSAGALPLVCQDHDVKVSPFDGLRWEGDQPEVLVETTWYRPVSINGVTVASVLEFCDKRWPRQRQKRFGEDLGEALHLMGHKVGTAAKLELVELDGGKSVTLDAVPMTRAKRQAITMAGRTVKASVRTPRVVGADVARSDIETFGEGLKAQFAYLETKGIDLDAELERLAGELDGEINVTALSFELQRLLNRFGDGHARATSGAPWDRGLRLPVLFDSSGDGIVAFHADRSGLLDDERPYVQSMDGMSMGDWVEAMRPFVVDGSPQIVQHRALRGLRALASMRNELGMEASESVELVISSKPKGGKKKTVELALQKQKPIYGDWPRTDTRKLVGKDAARADGGIGVLRLRQMHDKSIPSMRKAMKRFEDTHGLIVDVRGNGGGQRGLLAALGGYLISDDAGPVIGNVAAYRLAPQFKDDHLGGSRLLYRADDPHWSDAQKAAIATFAEGFQPEWEPPAGFSDWHYLVLDRTGHSSEYFYGRPVVVLTDAACFSATDIFAAALGALPNVTLMGTATGGGSARSEDFRLPGTGIQVVCASMASFQPGGQLYDGNGVAVDIEVHREPEDLVKGGEDAQLQAAVKWLAKQR